MANTSQTTRTSSALGQWVEDLYERVFCQSNDEVSVTTMNENFAEDFTATINHDRFPRQDFIETAKKARLTIAMSAQGSKEIQSWDAPDGSGGGCVALLMRFKDTIKETGVVTEVSTLMVANVQVIGGKRKLFSVTEVMKQGE